MILRALALAGLAAAPVAPAPGAVTLPPQVEAECIAEGGCVWVSRTWLQNRLDEAAKAGQSRAEVRCGRIL